MSKGPKGLGDWNYSNKKKDLDRINFEKKMAEVCQRAIERGEQAKPNLDEDRLKSFMDMKHMLYLMGRERTGKLIVGSKTNKRRK